MPNNLATALSNSDLLFDENDIDTAVARIAADIREDYPEDRPVVGKW